ncbi:MAG: hypothetical protein LJE70_18275 [Chromatiaceae bacterium]|nr:hypothetical protein [Chromatiaceae bacterium]
MYNFPKTEKKLKSQISSYRSSLLKEKKKFGFVDDGQGKRYLLFTFYFVLNDIEETKEYIEWYEKEFSDDMGEPIQKLCWALSLRRMDNEAGARKMLAETMLSNLYLIPKLLDQQIAEYDIWQLSSDGHIGYADYIPKEVISSITDAETQWLRQQYDSLEFRRIRNRYIDIYGKLKNTKEIDERTRLLEESHSLLDTLNQKRS